MSRSARKSIIALAIALTISPATWAGEEQKIAELISNKQWNDAQQVIDQWQPADPNAKLFMQHRLENAKDPEMAILRLQEFLIKAPNYPEAYNNLALHLIDHGEYKQASEWLLKGMATDKRYQQLYENLTKLYTVMASKAYQKALGKNQPPPQLPAFANFDYLYTGLGAPSEIAVTMVAPVIASKPTVATPAAPAAATQATAPVAQDNGLLQNQLTNQLNGWAKAWSSQQVDKYLAYYSSDFRPTDGLSIDTWRQQRNDRLKAPRFIQVTVSNPEITLLDDGSVAKVRFMQHYRSNTFNEKVIKLLVWEQQQGEWRILQEEIAM
ncbi:MAG: nuclear transport factor 2 family protein [Gammaproteobacteria bacterium]|nr:nuclear transport factor 2 family protein [Gammaproteobacteria bacterium]